MGRSLSFCFVRYPYIALDRLCPLTGVLYGVKIRSLPCPGNLGRGLELSKNIYQRTGQDVFASVMDADEEESFDRLRTPLVVDIGQGFPSSYNLHVLYFVCEKYGPSFPLHAEAILTTS